jgi:RecB family exonuclease
VSLTVAGTAYGAPALERLDALIREAKGRDALGPATVLVPTNYAGVATRRALGRRSGIAAVTFLTVYRLAELLGAPALAAQGRRPVSTPVVAGAVRQALASAPGVFASVRDHPSTEHALLEAHRELRDLDDRRLARLASASRRAADVVRIHRTVTERLAPRWYDERDLLEAAHGAMEAGVPLAAALGTIIVYLPQELSLAEARLVTAVAQRRPVIVIAGFTGEADADSGVRRTLTRLGAVEDVEVEVDGLSAEVRVVTASDADEEVRAALRHVMEAVGRGVPLDRIGICYASGEPYARVVGEQLDAAAIARNGRATLTLRERVASRVLLGLLGLPDRGFRRHDVFALLATAPLRDSNGRPVPVARWERLSREAGVVDGLDQWSQRLSRLAERLDAEAGASDDNGEAAPWRAQRARAGAAEARALITFVGGLAARLDVATADASWSTYARLGHDLLHHYLGSEAVRARWPETEAVAFDRVAAALDRLGGLDSIDPGPSLDVFRRTLELELDADLGRVGRLGEGVFVGPLGLAIAQDLDVVVVVGLAEGTFPTRPVDDALVPDRERALLDGALELARDEVPRQHHQLLAAIAGAGSEVILCTPRGDLRRSTHRVPSRWLLDAASDRAGVRLRSGDLERRRDGWIEHVASFASGVRSADFPVTAQEHHLRGLLEQPETGLVPSELQHDPAFRAGEVLLVARRSHDFTAYDGNLAGVSLPVSPPDAALSATRLEAWAKCPLAYLLRHVLRVEEVENPEDLLEMSALERGNLLHRTFERFISGVLADPPAPDEAWTDDDVDRLLHDFHVEAATFEAAGLTGRDLFWRRDVRLLERTLREFLAADSKWRRTENARPLAAELRFGFDGGDPAVEIDLGDRRVVRLRGSADRIDRAPAHVYVTDYKSGSPNGYRKLKPPESTVGGTHLQLPVYALAARAATGTAGPVTAAFWFVSTKHSFKRIGYEVDAAVLDGFRADLRVIVDGIAAGVFPAHPRRPGWQLYVPCAYCDPDGLGTGERWREWERKKAQPALGEYLSLAERQP